MLIWAPGDETLNLPSALYTLNQLYPNPVYFFILKIIKKNTNIFLRFKVHSVQCIPAGFRTNSLEKTRSGALSSEMISVN